MEIITALGHSTINRLIRSALLIFALPLKKKDSIEKKNQSHILRLQEQQTN